MRYAKLGSSDLTVSRICLGCMGFGNPETGQHTWTIGEEETGRVIAAALAGGINFFDTAIAYQMGTSEQFVGRALRKLAARDEVVVATKFLPRTAEEVERGVSGQEHIARSIDRSLRNLGMDHVDLYIYHIWDWNTPLHDVLEGLADVVRAGKVREIGIANVFAWQLEKANALAEREGFPKFVSVQNHMNLLFREDEREMLPCAREEGIALTPYSPLAGGRLSRTPGETTKRLVEDSYARLKYGAAEKMDAPIVARVAEVAEAHGVPMTTVALAWLLGKTTAPVVGATKASHIEGMLKAVELELSQEETAYLEEPYVPHEIVGVMAQNTANSTEEHVWETANKPR